MAIYWKGYQTEVDLLMALGLWSKIRVKGKDIGTSYLLLCTKYSCQMEIATYYATTCQQLEVLNINLQFDNDYFINM